MGSDLFLVYGAYILAAGSPGPSNLAIMSAAMEKGRGSAMAMAAGVVTISFAWGLIAVYASLNTLFSIEIIGWVAGLLGRHGSSGVFRTFTPPLLPLVQLEPVSFASPYQEMNETG